MSNFVAKT